MKHKVKLFLLFFLGSVFEGSTVDFCERSSTHTRESGKKLNYFCLEYGKKRNYMSLGINPNVPSISRNELLREYLGLILDPKEYIYFFSLWLHFLSETSQLSWKTKKKKNFCPAKI